MKTFRIFILVILFTVFSGLSSLEADGLPRIMILATGGTIAGTGTRSTQTVGYAAAKIGVDALIASVPELTGIARVSGEQVLQLANENMTPADWLKLARRVNQLLAKSDVDGIVITHGDGHAGGVGLLPQPHRQKHETGCPHRRDAARHGHQRRRADEPLPPVLLAGSPSAAGMGVLVMLNDQISAAREVSKDEHHRRRHLPDPGFRLSRVHHRRETPFLQGHHEAPHGDQ